MIILKIEKGKRTLDRERESQSIDVTRRKREKDRSVSERTDFDREKTCFLKEFLFENNLLFRL